MAKTKLRKLKGWNGPVAKTLQILFLHGATYEDLGGALGISRQIVSSLVGGALCSQRLAVEILKLKSHADDLVAHVVKAGLTPVAFAVYPSEAALRNSDPDWPPMNGRGHLYQRVIHIVAAFALRGRGISAIVVNIKPGSEPMHI